MEPLAAELVPIEYQTPEDSPLRPFIRLMSAASMCKGLSSGVSATWMLSWHPYPGAFSQNILPAVVGLGLVGGGWLCWRLDFRGRLMVIWFSALTAVVSVLTTTVQYAHYFSSSPAMRSAIVFSLTNSLGALVLPATIWLFFRRPEVAAAMREE